MKKTKITAKFISFVLVLVLIAATGIFTMACAEQQIEQPSSKPSFLSSEQSTASVSSKPEPADDYGSDAVDMGVGQTAFIFRVTDLDNNSRLYRVYTDKKTVGEALQEIGLIKGEKGPYGLYVNEVNGISVDNKKTAWMLYIDNDQAMTGVDSVKIEAGKEYTFRQEKIK